MSNPDSFIDEVTEEVRRDRLYGVFRKYGWIGVVLVLGIVGGTAYNEWQKSRAEARAQAFGDALIEALDAGGPEGRREALAAVPADGTQATLLRMIEATDPTEDRAATLAALDKVIADGSAPPVWRDLAVLRRVTVLGAEAPLAERRLALEGIAAPGRPYRALAAEQLALLLIEEGKRAEAIAALTALTEAQDATQALRSRAADAITALGGSLAAPAAETAPAEDSEDAG